MSLKSIQTLAEYEQALKRLWELWDCKREDDEFAEFVELATLITNYDAVHEPEPEYPETD